MANVRSLLFVPRETRAPRERGLRGEHVSLLFFRRRAARSGLSSRFGTARQHDSAPDGGPGATPPGDSTPAPPPSASSVGVGRHRGSTWVKATLGDGRPMPPPMYRARVANAPPPRPARDGPPWHLGTLPNETPMLPTRPATPATRDDVPARVSGTAQAESPLGSCPSSIDLPIISSSTSTCLLECGRLCNTSCSLDS